MKKLVIVKPGTLSPKDKEKLTKSGHVVIEHPEPNFVHTRDLEDSEPLIAVPCARCGYRIYMTDERLKTFQRTGNTFYCSLGHSNSYPTK